MMMMMKMVMMMMMMIMVMMISLFLQLDGIDTRTGLLRKPLLDLSSHLHSLHDGIVSRRVVVPFLPSLPIHYE